MLFAVLAGTGACCGGNDDALETPRADLEQAQEEIEQLQPTTTTTAPAPTTAPATSTTPATNEQASDGSQVGTEAGLVDFVDQLKAAFVSVDFEAMHRMQRDGCDYSLEEVTEGFQQVQAMTLAFFGTTLSDVMADITFEITSFDEELLTAVVRSTYVGDIPALAADGDDLLEHRFVDGSWTSDGDCIGTELQDG